MTRTTGGQEDAELRYVDVLGQRVYVRRRPREDYPPQPLGMPTLLTIVGLLVTAFHELTYRQTGGDEFPVLRVLSHAGGDMLMLLGVLVVVAILARKIASRGVG